MPSKTVKHFYEEIKFLSAEIGRLGVPKKFIEVAKQQDEEKIEEIFEQFVEENPKLWKRLSKLYADYAEVCYPIVFDDDDTDEGAYTYDPNQINPVNICFICLFSECEMSEKDIFLDYCILQRALREEQPELADHMDSDSMECLIYDLVTAFEQK